MNVANETTSPLPLLPAWLRHACRDRGTKGPPRAGEGGAPRSGEGEGAVAVRAMRPQPPHLPIAVAMGPLLSREGRGNWGLPNRAAASNAPAATAAPTLLCASAFTTRKTGAAAETTCIAPAFCTLPHRYGVFAACAAGGSPSRPLIAAWARVM